VQNCMIAGSEKSVNLPDVWPLNTSAIFKYYKHLISILSFLSVDRRYDQPYAMAKFIH